MASSARPLNDIFQNTTIDTISEVGHGIDSLPQRDKRHGEIRLMPSTSRDSLKMSSSPRFSVAIKYGVWKRL
jgi:hypothetical protein